MTFRDIKNNEAAVKRISDSIINGNISHAYIFEANTCTDKRLLADSFAKAVLCRSHLGAGCDSCVICKKIGHGNHEDVIYTEKDGISVKDEAIEELQVKLKRKPFAGERSIAIIDDADTMTARAQNRLLKTLEEPFPGTVIILLSCNIENLAKTILSRCVVVRWRPFATEDGSELLKEAERLIKMFLEGEPFYLNKPAVMNFSENRDEAYKLLDSMEIICGGHIRERSCGREAVSSAVSCIEEARQDLSRGLNVGYALKSMILKMEDKQW